MTVQVRRAMQVARDFSADVEQLKRDVDQLGVDLRDAASESADQLKSKVTEAQAAVDRDVTRAQQQTAQSVNSAQDHWAQIRADIKAKLDQRHAQLYANASAIDAEAAEEDAIAALAFADWAVGNARVRLLRALEWRVEATVRAAEARP
jgi:hypothetical protein